MASVTQPRHRIYNKIKIATTPKGPAVTGVVKFNITASKQRLATHAIGKIIFNIIYNYTIYA